MKLYSEMKYRMQLIVLFTVSMLVFPVFASDSQGEKADLAPDFKLRDVSGIQHSMKSLQQRGHVLLLFWSMDCIYCKVQMPEYQRVYTEFRQRGLEMAAINLGGEYFEDILAYRDENDLEFIFLSNRQHNMKVAETYAVNTTPTLILVSPAGEIVYRGYAIPDLNEWLPAQQQVKKQETKQEKL